MLSNMHSETPRCSRLIITALLDLYELVVLVILSATIRAAFIQALIRFYTGMDIFMCFTAISVTTTIYEYPYGFLSLLVCGMYCERNFKIFMWAAVLSFLIYIIDKCIHQI